MTDRSRAFVLGLVIILFAVEGAGTVAYRGPQSPPIDTNTLAPMPSEPAEVWRATASDYFAGIVDPRMSVIAGDDDTLVLFAYSTTGRRTAAVLAVDAETGVKRWPVPRMVESPNCVLHDGGALACVDLVRIGDHIGTEFAVLSPDTGQPITTTVLDHPGTPTLGATDTGFVVAIDGRETTRSLPSEVEPGPLVAITGFEPQSQWRANLPDSQALMVGFDTAGARQWTTEPPLNSTRLIEASASDLVSLTNEKADSVTIHQTSSGRLVRTIDNASDASILLYAGGFAVSTGMYSQSTTTEFFDAAGERRGTLRGWRIAEPYAGTSMHSPRVTRTRIPVLSTWGYQVGTASGETDHLEWSVDDGAQGIQSDSVTVGDRHTVLTSREESDTDGRSTTVWRLVDIESLATSTAANVGFGQSLIGFDGRRLVFAGDADADSRPSTPRLTAYDARTGAELWTFMPAAADSKWHRFGKHLYLIRSEGRSMAFYSSERS